MSEKLEETTSKKGKKEKKLQNENEHLEKIQTLEQELEESKDKYLRLFAEFDNFKKRNTKERFDLIRTASQETIQSLLPVLDDFDRAKKNADKGNESFSEGVQLVYQKLYSVLESKGLKVMETENQDFDPEYHDAITDIPAPTEEMVGKIIDTIEKGYLLHDKIIRHAKVVVGK